jgi:hypothetical protein
MSQRDHDRRSTPGQTRPPAAPARRSANPVLALQRAIGNRGTAQALARKKGDKNKASFEHSVWFGAHGPIEIKDSNIPAWMGKDFPDDLVLTTTMGKHSEDLKRMSEGRARVETITVESVVGENTLARITFKNGRFKSYAADSSDKTEQWTVTDFKTAKREKISIGAAR